MTHMTNDGFYDEPDEIHKEDVKEPKKRRWLFRLLIVAFLAAFGSGSAYAWRAFDGNSMLLRASTTQTAEGDLAGQRHVEEIRQLIAASAQSTERVLAAQQAELKRLTDQVALLTNKLNLLQQPITTAQGAIASPPAPPKKPAATKPLGAKPAG